MVDRFVKATRLVARKVGRWARAAYHRIGRFLAEVDLSHRVPAWASVRKAQAYGLFALIVLASWLRGGTDPALHGPIAWVTALLTASFFFLAPDERAGVFGEMKADPVFKYGALLLGLIILQTLNSSYAVATDPTGVVEFTRAPPRLFPWSVERSASWELFTWFFPAFVGAMIARHMLEWRHIKLLLHLLLWNAGALALVGIVQHFASPPDMLGIWTVQTGRFFATFDYVNHAAEWFYLNAFVALALLKDNFDKHKPPMQAAVWAVILLLCVLAALLTLSRFGAVIALAILFVGLALIARKVLLKVSGAGTANVVIALLVVAMLGVVLFLGAGGGELAREIGDKPVLGEQSVAGDLGERAVQMPMALAMVADYPLFGSGGWGYASLARMYVPMDNETLWTAAGKANVHCDPLQFFSEFGVLGEGALLWILFQLGRSARNQWKKTAIHLWIGLGIGVIAFHSLIDLPFRCPAILYLWTILLAALPKFSKHATGRARGQNADEVAG